MKRLLLIVVLFFLNLASLFAAQISIDEALNKALIFYTQQHPSALRTTPDCQLVYTGREDSGMLRSVGSPAYLYLFNVGDSGFVIVSGDDATEPILGYSNEGVFSPGNIPAGMQGWLDMYEESVKRASTNPRQPNDSLSGVPMTENMVSLTVTPLLDQIRWGQGDPFNQTCPYDTKENARALTGCGATAMAQIMKYYEWPVKGIGSHTYEDDTYGIQTAGFGNTTYDWANMLDSYGEGASINQKAAVSTLMYHCGVSIEMDYGVDGSSSYLTDIAVALMTYFNYDEAIELKERSFYTSSEWKAVIKHELVSARPVLYRGSTATMGHLFVCDGVDESDFFHINWGWDGFCNGYFNIDVLEPYYAETNGFNQGQMILTGIRKPNASSLPLDPIRMYSNGMSTDSTRLSTNSSSTMSISYGFANYGVATFNGDLGWGLYKGTVFQGRRNYISKEVIKPFYGYKNYVFTLVSLTPYQAGNYQLRCIYRQADSVNWSFMRGYANLNSYLNVTIANYVATISKPVVEKPSLVLTQTIRQKAPLYQNEQAEFSVTIRNDATEFFSNLDLRLSSVADTSNHQYLNYGIVCIPSGETKTFNIAGMITLPPGNYVAKVVHDSTNNASVTNYKSLSPNDLNKLNVTVYQPGAGLWTSDDIRAISIHPNPVKTWLSIQAPDETDEVLVLDFSGRVLIRASGVTTIYTGNLQKGLYFLKVKMGKTTQTIKFFKL